MEKVTDNDIIKALECCSNENTGCLDCSYIGKISCAFDLRKDALDLIKRKDAEIEKLNVELVGIRGACESYRIHYDVAQAEIERLQKEKAKLHQLIPKMIKEAKSEAYKEFAELVKTEFYKEFDELIPSIMADRIDNLVKEMTEEEAEAKLKEGVQG
jgi:hypothetical protein